MVFSVQLWLSLERFPEPDITCAVDACSVEEAAQRAMWLSHLERVAYASVDMVIPVPGTIIARAWGPVLREVA